MVIDDYRYYTFASSDTSRRPAAIIAQIPTELNELDSSVVGNIFDHGGAIGVYIGEYSITLGERATANLVDGAGIRHP